MHQPKFMYFMKNKCCVLDDLCGTRFVTAHPSNKVTCLPKTVDIFCNKLNSKNTFLTDRHLNDTYTKYSRRDRFIPLSKTTAANCQSFNPRAACQWNNPPHFFIYRFFCSRKLQTVHILSVPKPLNVFDYLYQRPPHPLTNSPQVWCGLVNVEKHYLLWGTS